MGFLSLFMFIKTAILKFCNEEESLAENRAE